MERLHRDCDESLPVHLENQVTESLADQMENEGKRPLYDVLLPFTHLEAKPTSIAEAAEKLGMNEAPVKTAISRLRQQLREAVAETLGPGEDLEAEVLYLSLLLVAAT